MQRFEDNRRCARSFRRTRKPDCGPAFTLVELLTVIAVIALLAAPLLPSLSRAKAAGSRTVCRSNLHQIGLALHMYLGDFRRYPIRWEVPLVAISIQDGNRVESGCLLPYLRERHKVFFCPVQEDCPIRRVVPDSDGDTRISGYALNANGTAHSAEFMALRLGLGIGSPLREVGEESIRCPSDMIAFGDGYTGAIDFSPFDFDPTQWKDAFRVPVSLLPSPRHLGGANILFCDGHVESQKQARWIEATDTARARWNNDHEPHRETW
jgi:prepilin-type processing-associated H-X9-DG protein